MKWKPPWNQWQKKGKELFSRYKFVLAVVVVGLVLLLWPDGKNSEPQPEAAPAQMEEDFSVAALEEKLAQALSRIDGAGDVTVMLTVQGGARRVLAEDEKLSRETDGASQSERQTVVVSGGSSRQEEPITLQQLYPKFQGALVVCEGGGRSGVRLKLMEAVSALTGLGADKISICEGKG